MIDVLTIDCSLTGVVEVLMLWLLILLTFSCN